MFWIVRLKTHLHGLYFLAAECHLLLDIRSHVVVLPSLVIGTLCLSVLGFIWLLSVESI